MHGAVSSHIISSVFMGLSQCTFFFRSESIDTFLKFLNTRTKFIFIALDKTHISTSIIFTKFTVFQMENTTSLRPDYSYLIGTCGERVGADAETTSVAKTSRLFLPCICVPAPVPVYSIWPMDVSVQLFHLKLNTARK